MLRGLERGAIVTDDTDRENLLSDGWFEEATIPGLLEVMIMVLGQVFNPRLNRQLGERQEGVSDARLVK